MISTTAQNKAHKLDGTWIKTASRTQAAGEHWLSEYTNGFTGQVIRKGWRMTGQDWYIFDAEGNVTGRARSLTWAKLAAADKI